MKLLVLGAGAVGGYFGARLQQAGSDVTFLVRPQRQQALAERGLVLKSPKGNATLKVATVTAQTAKPDYDLVLLTCKAYDLDDAMAAIAPAVGPQTAIVPILNGMRHLDVLDERFGRERVLGGVARISSTLGPNGEIVHNAPLAGVLAGERERGRTPRPALADLDTALKAAGVDGGCQPDIVQDMWDKWIFLCSLAAMTCAMRGPVGPILAAEDGEALMRETVAECHSVAVAEGHDPGPRGLATIFELLTTRGSKFAASMLHDLEKGGRVEAAHVVGDMLARARRAKLPAPNLRFAYAHLQTYEARTGLRPIA